MCWLRIVTFIAAPLILSGCHYYEEFRMMKGTADIRSETADLIRAYRECMERYEKEPEKARDYCSGYSKTLREIQVPPAGIGGRDSRDKL